MPAPGLAAMVCSRSFYAIGTACTYNMHVLSKDLTCALHVLRVVCCAERFKRSGIELVLNSRVKAVGPETVTVVDKQNNVSRLALDFDFASGFAQAIAPARQSLLAVAGTFPKFLHCRLSAWPPGPHCRSLRFPLAPACGPPAWLCTRWCAPCRRSWARTCRLVRNPGGMPGM